MGGDGDHGELGRLLQFLYLCPFGLIEFENDGTVIRLNPAAVNQLVATLGVTDISNVYDTLSVNADLVASIRAVGSEAGSSVGGFHLARRVGRSTSVSVVRVSADRLMMTLLDTSSESARLIVHESLDGADSDDWVDRAGRVLCELCGAEQVWLWLINGDLDEAELTAVASRDTPSAVRWPDGPGERAWLAGTPLVWSALPALLICVGSGGFGWGRVGW